MDTSVTVKAVVDNLPLPLTGKGFPLGSLAATISYNGDFTSEFVGNPYPRYPMTLEASFIDGDFLQADFVTADGVVETLLPPMKKIFTFRSSWDFATGLVTPSAQGGKWEGAYLVQPMDNAAYPFLQAGFDPADRFQWIGLFSDLYITVNGPWWNSLRANVPLGSFSGVTKQISFTLTDGTGYRTKHTVYLQLWLPDPV